jgi:carboxypeptidase D
MAPSRSSTGWRRLPAIIAALALPWAATAAAGGKSAGDYFVHSLPGAPAEPLVKMHAGYVFHPKAGEAQPEPS